MLVQLLWPNSAGGTKKFLLGIFCGRFFFANHSRFFFPGNFPSEFSLEPSLRTKCNELAYIIELTWWIIGKLQIKLDANKNPYEKKYRVKKIGE